MQELGQSGISLIKKNSLKEQFEKVQGELVAAAKAKVAADSKIVRLESSYECSRHGH